MSPTCLFCSQNMFIYPFDPGTHGVRGTDPPCKVENPPITYSRPSTLAVPDLWVQPTTNRVVL